MIHYFCSSCQSPLESGDRFAGREISCPDCGQKIVVPPAPQISGQDMIADLQKRTRRKRAWVPIKQFALPPWLKRTLMIASPFVFLGLCGVTWFFAGYKWWDD